MSKRKRTILPCLLATAMIQWLSSPIWAGPGQITFTVDSELSPGIVSISWLATWDSYQAVNALGGSFLRHIGNNDGSTITFSPNLPDSGSYRVEVLFQNGRIAKAAMAATVPVDIISSGITLATSLAAQRANLGKWYSLGVYKFDAGNGGKVVIKTPPVGNVGVDSVRFTRIRPSVIVKSTDRYTSIDTAGSRWSVNTNPPLALDTKYRTDDNVAGKSFEFKASLPTGGAYDVYLWWIASPDNAADVPIDITDVFQTTTVFVDQTKNGSQWYYLGRFTFSSAALAKVKLRTTGSGRVIADAVQFAAAPVNEVIVDNESSISSGAWTAIKVQPAQIFGAASLLDSTTLIGDSVRFTPSLPASGIYSLYAWYTAAGQYAKTVPLEVTTASGNIETPPPLNQKRSGGQWVWVGNYNFDSGSSGSVLVQKVTHYPVSADAMEFLQGADTDCDGMQDSWEMQMFHNLDQTGTGDFDGDGVDNLTEYLEGRDPTKIPLGQNEGSVSLQVYTPME